MDMGPGTTGAKWLAAAARLAFATCLSAQAGAGAAQVRAPLPPAIQQEIAAQDRGCREEGGRLAVPPAVTPAQLNGDTQTDYVLDYSQARCTNWGAMSGFCGQLGCSVDVWLTLPGGLRKVASITTSDWKLDSSVRPNRFSTAVIGANGPTGKRNNWAWDGTKFAVVAAGPASPAQPAARTGGFQVSIALTPAAQTWYNRRQAQPVLLAVYEGDPKSSAPADLRHPAEDIIVLGEERVAIPLTGGTVRLTEGGIDRGLLRWVQGEPRVGLLVGEDRGAQASKETEQFLLCKPDGAAALSTLRSRGLQMRCDPPAP